MTVPRFPTTIEAITPAWLTDVLQSGGHLEDGAVTQVSAAPLGAGAGFLSHLARLTLTYDRIGAAGPPTLIAKVPTATPENRRVAHATRAYPHEVGFYRELAARSPLRTPRCYAAALDRPSGDFVLLLEDFSAARTVDLLIGCTPADAETVILALSRLHVAWRDLPALADLAWLRAPSDPRGMPATAAFHREAWLRFLEQYGDSSPPSARAIGTARAERIEDVLVRVGGPSQTLCHGDVRLDNLFFDLPDSPVAAVDWQYCSRAGGLVDVADFLIYNLDVATRRTHEHELLRYYHQALCDGGVAGYDFDGCLEDFRWAVLYGYRRAMFTGVAVPGNARGEALFASFRERCFAAQLDWDTGALLRG